MNVFPVRDPIMEYVLCSAWPKSPGSLLEIRSCSIYPMLKVRSSMNGKHFLEKTNIHLVSVYMGPGGTIPYGTGTA